MEAMRTKDKLFLAVVGPLAAVAVYVWLWRADAARRVEALEREDETLVQVEEFPARRLRAEKLMKAAKDAQAAEEKRPMPVAKIRANAEEDVAARERAVLEVFGRAGLVVEKSALAVEADPAARNVLQRTGFRPEPVCREYVLVGTYPQLCSALRDFATREMAVIPNRVNMPEPGHWSLSLWL